MIEDLNLWDDILIRVIKYEHISGFRHDVNEIDAVLRFYAA